MKNQPETMKNHGNRPGTMKTDVQPCKTNPQTMKNHEDRPGTMKKQPENMKKTMKTNQKP